MTKSFQARILIVDDELSNIELAADIFQDRYEALFALADEQLNQAMTNGRNRISFAQRVNC